MQRQKHSIFFHILYAMGMDNNIEIIRLHEHLKCFKILVSDCISFTFVIVRCKKKHAKRKEIVVILIRSIVLRCNRYVCFCHSSVIAILFLTVVQCTSFYIYFFLFSISFHIAIFVVFLSFRWYTVI